MAKKACMDKNKIIGVTGVSSINTFSPDTTFVGPGSDSPGPNRFDDKYIKSYLKELKKYTLLKDIGEVYIDKSGKKKVYRKVKNKVIEFFRSNPKSKFYTYIDIDGKERKVYRGTCPTYKDIRRHLNRETTLYFANYSNYDVIIINIDIDAKYKKNALILANRINDKYFCGQCKIDDSTGKKGAHLNFKLNISFIDRLIVRRSDRKSVV